MMELRRAALVADNPKSDTKSWRMHRLVQEVCLFRTKNVQEHFEAAVTLLLVKLPSGRCNTYDNDDWLVYERYVPHV
jgi:hypothetical protein